MSIANTRTALRTLLSGSSSTMLASVFDPLSARIAEELRYEAALMGGSIASHVVLAAPDLIVLTLTELAEQVHRCTRTSRVPLLVDGDHGYGNALNVMRTVAEMDSAGAAAVMIEDTLLPRAYGGSDALQLIALEEAVGKMKAAVKARGDSDIAVLARTGAASITSVDEAIERFRAFESTGVDALFLPGVRSREELERIAAAISLPLVAGGVPESLAHAGYLGGLGIRLYSTGHQPFAVAVNALYQAMKAVRDGAPASTLSGIAPKSLIDQLTRNARYAESVQLYLGPNGKSAS